MRGVHSRKFRNNNVLNHAYRMVNYKPRVRIYCPPVGAGLIDENGLFRQCCYHVVLIIKYAETGPRTSGTRGADIPEISKFRPSNRRRFDGNLSIFNETDNFLVPPVKWYTEKTKKKSRLKSKKCEIVARSG